MIFRSTRELETHYADLRAGDVFIGSLALKHLRQPVFIDLLERGVHCLPSPLSQILNRSKTAQAFLLKQWMLPHTLVIRRRSDLIRAISYYNKANIGAVVSKQDHMHCGHGIRKWNGIESLYAYMGLDESSYPFVLQPFVENFTDVRVLLVGEYREAYARFNPHNFRVNLSSGGTSTVFDLDDKMTRFCRSVMKRGNFPYAHIDLLVMENGDCFLSEIALNGGTKGAQISRRELEDRKNKVLENLAKELTNN
jgi:ribosomal protein S6--L-glutamate ligase